MTTKFERSAASLAIEQRLSQGSPDNEISSAEMEAICNRPCENARDAGWQTVAALLGKIERQYGLVWKWQRDRKCWRCLTDMEKPGVLDNRMLRMRSQSKRMLAVADSIDFERLPEDERKATISTMIVAGAVHTLTSGKAVKRIQASVDSKPSLPNMEQLIEACKARQK